MNRTLSLLILTAALLVFLAPASPVDAAELGRPTVYADAWGGAFQDVPPALTQPVTTGYAAGMSAGAYFDLASRLGGALRLTYWEAWDEVTLCRRYTGVDVLIGPRFGDLRLLAGLGVLDRRSLLGGDQAGGWGWRCGLSGERIWGRVVLGGGLYATPQFRLRRWAGSLELDPADATALEEEFYLVVPLGRAWALRGGFRGMQLGIAEPGGRHWDDGEGLFLGTTARF